MMFALHTYLSFFVVFLLFIVYLWCIWFSTVCAFQFSSMYIITVGLLFKWMRMIITLLVLKI